MLTNDELKRLDAIFEAMSGIYTCVAYVPSINGSQPSVHNWTGRLMDATSFKLAVMQWRLQGNSGDTK